MLNPACSWLEHERPEGLELLPRHYKQEGQENRRGTECQRRHLYQGQYMKELLYLLHVNALRRRIFASRRQEEASSAAKSTTYESTMKSYYLNPKNRDLIVYDDQEQEIIVIERIDKVKVRVKGEVRLGDFDDQTAAKHRKTRSRGRESTPITI